MAIRPDPKKLTVDYQKLLKLSVSERVKMAQSKDGQSYLASLTAGEYAALFPDYYKKQIPAYNKLASASPSVSLAQAGSGSTPGMRAPSSSGRDTATSQSNTPQTGRQDPEPKRPDTWLGKLEKATGVTRPQSSPNISTSPGGHPVLAQERAKYFEELDKDPKLKATVQSLILKENNRHPAGPLEALMNRASRDGKSIKSLVYGGFFGPINRGEVSPLTDNKSIEQSQKAFDKVRGGSNDIDLRTDQGLKNEHKWADSVSGEGRGRKKEINGEWYSDQNPKSEAWVKRIQGQIKSYDERPKPGNLGTESTKPLGVDAERNSKTTRLFFDEERPYTKEEHAALVKKYGADNISVGGFEHKYLEGRGGPTNEKWTADERARVEARAKALGMSFEQYRKSGFWSDVENDIKLHSKNGGKTHEIDNLGINGPNALDETVKHLEWLKENKVGSKLLLKNLDDKQILALAQRFPDYKNHVIGGFTEADTGSYRSQSERVSAIDKAYKEIGLTSTFAPDVKASEKYKTPGDRYGGAILRVEGLVKPGSVSPALAATPAPALPEGLRQDILDEYNSMKTDEDKNYFRHQVNIAMREKKMSVEDLNKHAETPAQAQPTQTAPAAGGLVSPVTGFYAKNGASNVYGASRSQGARRHSGIDWQAENGSSVHAMTGGEVLYAGTNKGYGANIVVKGDDGVIRRYAAHGAVANKKPGSRVEQGENIGTIGGGHLHYEEVHPKDARGKPNPTYERFLKTPGIFVNTSDQEGTTDPSKTLGLKPGMAVKGGQPVMVPQLERPKPGDLGTESTKPLGVDAERNAAPVAPPSPAAGPAVPVQPPNPIPTATPASPPVAQRGFTNPVAQEAAANKQDAMTAMPAPAALPPPPETPSATPADNSVLVPPNTPESKHGGEIQAEGDNAYIINRSGKILSSVNPEKESINLDNGRIKVNPLNRTNPDDLQAKARQQVTQRIEQADQRLDRDSKGAMTPARSIQQNQHNPNHQKMMEEDTNRSGKTFLSPSAERAFASHRFFDNSRGGHYSFGTSTLKLV